jgi:predicted Zn-dependent protease
VTGAWRMGVAFLPLLAACELATPPDRTETYDYTPRLLNGFPLVFRWPATSLPVRIWTEPVLDLPHHLTEAIAIWQGGVLYGEVRAIPVEDSTDADVIILLGDAEAALSGDRACTGSTRLEVDLDTAIVLPFRSRVAPRAGASSSAVQSCLATAVAHEVGHVLGLFLHSSDPDDLMYGSPTVDALSARDVATLQTLYHSAPTVHLPPGR